MSNTESMGQETLADLIKEIWQGRVFVLAGVVVAVLAAPFSRESP